MHCMKRKGRKKSQLRSSVLWFQYFSHKSMIFFFFGWGSVSRSVLWDTLYYHYWKRLGRVFHECNVGFGCSQPSSMISTGSLFICRFLLWAIYQHLNWFITALHSFIVRLWEAGCNYWRWKKNALDKYSSWCNTEGFVLNIHTSNFLRV